MMNHIAQVFASFAPNANEAKTEKDLRCGRGSSDPSYKDEVQGGDPRIVHPPGRGLITEPNLFLL